MDIGDGDWTWGWDVGEGDHGDDDWINGGWIWVIGDGWSEMWSCIGDCIVGLVGDVGDDYVGYGGD